MITAEYVEKYVALWEARHDSWVSQYLASLLGTDKKTMSEIRPILKKKTLTDWRVALAFFIDRTTYQSRKDIINLRTATYLFKKIISLPEEFSVEENEKLLQEIKKEKATGRVTHIRERADIERLEAVLKYLQFSKEKNFTKIILSIPSEKELWKFLDQFPFVSKNKTAPFYMKFISWAHDINIEPIAIDRHVINSLASNGLSNKSSSKAIMEIANQLNMPAVKVETALYEDSWRKSNNDFFKCR
ncbi:MAG: hypothetical protein PHH87_02745 [Desulfuromonas sp.]|nr:hypothetical protein [Desulfuromonas sp.]